MGPFYVSHARVSLYECSIKSKLANVKTGKRFHSTCNDVKFVWTVMKYCMGDIAGFDTQFHYIADSSHPKQCIIFSYLIDNPKCSLNNCLVTVESS